MLDKLNMEIIDIIEKGVLRARERVFSTLKRIIDEKKKELDKLSTELKEKKKTVEEYRKERNELIQFIKRGEEILNRFTVKIKNLMEV